MDIPSAHDVPPIDRVALVARHRIVHHEVNVGSPLSVGNGRFCFTADVTGLQTFEDDHGDRTRLAMPLSTMADWGWHSHPNPDGFTWESFPHTPYESQGRQVGHLYYEAGKSPSEQKPAARWLRSNPHRLHLGKIGLTLKNGKGEPAAMVDLQSIHQDLDLWTGILTSSFQFDGQPVRVITTCHGHLDQLAVSIESPLVADGRLRVAFSFPYGSAEELGNGADWTNPEAHQTKILSQTSQRLDLERTLDADQYWNTIVWESPGQMSAQGRHRFVLSATPGTTRIVFVSSFSPKPSPPILADFEASLATTRDLWRTFWSHGGAIDLSGSRDPRWFELERRIVLSQYLTRIQSAGDLPPQESGLTINTWHGKFHLEMYWWHVAHWALWERQDLMAPSMGFFQRILPVARKIAEDQGYPGVRWPKCVGPYGMPSPTYLEAFLLWQQPHPIVLAELCYRADPSPAVLARYQEIVDQTAKFMAGFATWNGQRGMYEIGPPATDAAEIYYEEAATTKNLNFENAYWHLGLEIAQRWRQRLHLEREPTWDHVLANIPPLAQRDGVYVAGETHTKTWEKGFHWSHPDMLGPLGMMDGAMVDHQVMRRTLTKVMQEWDWPSTWGWDFPEVAMCAARLGDGATAIDALLMPSPKNTYLANGHNWQTDGLCVYLPGNGGLLYAVALMAAGWDGAPNINAPGFPQDGSWKVRWEGLKPAPADYHSPQR